MGHRAGVAADLTPADLRQALRERLAPWKIPERLLVLPAFPQTLRGKTDRRRIGVLLASPGTLNSGPDT
jgi:acyl-CoA synthetase (AMP-forming)/AMP-acid ligase II